jgi:hypothetical protein
VTRARCLVVASVALLGCPDPSTYGTPRTIPAGRGQHTIAVEGLYVTGKVPVLENGTTTKKFDDSGTILLPTYQYRHGIADRFDFGVRVTAASGFGADAKWNFVRGVVDLAIDPGVQWVYVPRGEGFSLFYLHGPLVAGVNVTEKVTIVLTPGIVYAATVGSSASSVRNAIVSSGGALARLGLGVNVRAGKILSLMPEVTAMRAFNDTQGIIVVGGVSFKLGAQPLTDSEIEAHSQEPPPSNPSPMPPMP